MEDEQHDGTKELRRQLALLRTIAPVPDATASAGATPSTTDEALALAESLILCPTLESATRLATQKPAGSTSLIWLAGLYLTLVAKYGAPPPKNPPTNATVFHHLCASTMDFLEERRREQPGFW